MKSDALVKRFDTVSSSHGSKIRIEHPEKKNRFSEIGIEYILSLPFVTFGWNPSIFSQAKNRISIRKLCIFEFSHSLKVYSSFIFMRNDKKLERGDLFISTKNRNLLIGGRRLRYWWRGRRLWWPVKISMIAPSFDLLPPNTPSSYRALFFMPDLNHLITSKQFCCRLLTRIT